MHRNIRRIIAAALAFVMMSGMAAFAAQSRQQKAVALVSQLKIIQGDTDGNMRLEDPVTRAEFAKIAIAASVHQNSIAANLTISPFKDVSYTHWASPYIRVALNHALISGYPDGSYRPDEKVLLEEALTIALKLLGYNDADFGGSWPSGQVNLANTIGLSDNISAPVGQFAARSDIAILIYNMLNCNTKQSNQKYIESIGYKYYENVTITATNRTDPSLEANQVRTSQGIFRANSFDNNNFGLSGEMLVNSKQEIISFQPLYRVATVNQENWQNYIGITDATKITVTRDGKNASLNDIMTNDTVYYYQSSNTLQAYSKRLTGIYEGASPNKDSLTSITVSGNTYNVETLSAFEALSSGGRFQFGDTITLLFGRSNQVAGVISPNASNTTSFGFLYGAGKKEFTNAEGESYSSHYVQVALTDGTTYEYASDKDYSTFINSVVQLSFIQGKAALTVKRGQNDLYGTVNLSAGKLGSFTLSSDVQILDVSTTNADSTGLFQSVFPQRLDGMSLSSNDIIFYQKNDKNEISKLILRNVTGDMYEYGLILSASNNSGGGMSVNGSYTYDLKGTTQSFSSSGTTYPVSKGQPVRLIFTGNRLERIEPIHKLDSAVTNLTETYIEAGSNRYLLSDTVFVYKRINYDEFMFVPLSEINTKDYTVTAYYDRSLSDGGRVRVLIAQ